MKNFRKVKFIAEKVRLAFEEISEKENYGEASAFNSDLGGYCGRAAIQLYLACKKAGIKIKIFEGIGHAFNEYDGYIIDITATQFGKYPKIYIKKHGFQNGLEFYKKVRTHLSTKSLAKSFWIPQNKIDSDKKVVSKYFPGRTGGQEESKKCQS